VEPRLYTLQNASWNQGLRL